MHRTSITEAALLTALLFNTVFIMPPNDGLLEQIFGVAAVFVALLWLIECARKWEKKIKERRRRDDKRKSI